ncbi:unnamed protein product [Arctogadus glacialis]
MDSYQSRDHHTPWSEDAMANVKVAVRVRPLTAKETLDGGRLAVQVEDKHIRVRNGKLDGRFEGAVDSREKLLEFGFDYCYWSVDAEDPRYASQEEEVEPDLGGETVQSLPLYPGEDVKCGSVWRLLTTKTNHSKSLPPSTSEDVFVGPSQRWRCHGVPHTELCPGQRLTGLFISPSLCRFSGWFWAFGILSLQSSSELSGLERPGGLSIPPLTPGPQWAQSGLAEEHAIGTF